VVHGNGLLHGFSFTLYGLFCVQEEFLVCSAVVLDWSSLVLLGHPLFRWWSVRRKTRVRFPPVVPCGSYGEIGGLSAVSIVGLCSRPVPRTVASGFPTSISWVTVWPRLWAVWASASGLLAPPYRIQLHLVGALWGALRRIVGRIHLHNLVLCFIFDDFGFLQEQYGHSVAFGGFT